MRVEESHILCVGFDTQPETQIINAITDRMASTKISKTSDSSEAIDHLESKSVDCVISSEILADMSGICFLRTVRDSFPRLPYILFVDDLSYDFINKAIDAGVTDYLPRDGSKAQASRLANRVIDVIDLSRFTERAAELERINAVVRDLNRELVNASTKDEVDQRVCEIISESEPYLFAWVGDHDPNTQTVTRRAAAGFEESYLDEITITTDEKQTAQGLTGEAVTTHEVQVAQNIVEDSANEPWREQARERGYRSRAAIPLVYDETLYGVLNIYTDRTQAFDKDEQALLEELGTTIAHAHHDIHVHREARRFQRAVEQAADAIFITDTNGTIEFVNPAFEELTGYTASEAKGRNPRILKSGEQPIEYYERMWKTILDGKIWESEIIDTKRSGEQYYAQQTVAPFRDGSDSVEGFVAIQRDVTEQKERERELEQRRARLRILFDEAPDGIVVHDIEGEILDVNETLIENIGYTREELLSMDVFDFEVGAHEEIIRDQWESMVPGSIHKAEIEGTHQRKDGSTYPCEVWISRVTGESQEADRFIALTRDITERKKRGQEQKETQRRLELAVETADAGVWEWDIQSKTILWEDSMEKLLGLEPGAFGGTYEEFIERVHPDDRSAVEQTVERTLKQQTGFEREFRLRHESGDFIWFLTRARMFRNTENSPERMIGVGIDISEKIDQIQQLEVLDRVLRHNLRNDMGIIQGYAETIQDGVDCVTEETEMIIKRSQKLMETVDKEREIVKLLSERPAPEEIDIVDVCQQVVSDTRRDYPDAFIEADCPDVAAVTAMRNIKRAIEELIENALIHNDQETPKISVLIESRDEMVRIEIADNGPGISESEVNIFTREYEIEPLYHGSGIGLWLVNWIVKLSDGTLSFEKNYPRGSVITIELNQLT